MWEMIKNDPLLKTVFVGILGVLAFGLAFNIMFGPNTAGMEHGGQGGYALTNSLAYILGVLFNLFLIALVIAGFVLLFRMMSKHRFSANNFKFADLLPKEPMMKILVGVVLVALAIWLIMYLFGAMFGYGPAMMGPGVGGTFALVGFFKMLLVLFILTGLFGLAMYLHGNKQPQETCSTCGGTLKAEWKCCPACGNEKGITVNITNDVTNASV